jgi:hypothetical protein
MTESHLVPLARSQKLLGQRRRQLVMEQVLDGVVGDAVLSFELGAGVAHCPLNAMFIDRLLHRSTDC